MKLKNKVAIVTGGGKGIGEEISLGLAKEGAKVVVADLDKENSSNVVKEILKNSGKAIYVETDVSNEASVKNLISETINRFDQIDILINNAGIRHVKKLENHDLSDWNDMISVNLTGPSASISSCIFAAARCDIHPNSFVFNSSSAPLRANIIKSSSTARRSV